MATTKVSTKLLETVGVAEGGTGATSTSAARTSLGLVIGTNVLAPNGSAASLTNLPAGGASAAEAANIMLNAFRISVNGGLSVQNMVDGFVDEFEDELGIDTGASTNETYDAAGDFYHNAGSIDANLLIHCDGSDTSTTFTDIGASAHTITTNGNAQVDTGQSKFGGGSLLLDGSNDYLSIVDHNDFKFGTGDFTVECFVRFNSLASNAVLISFGGVGFVSADHDGWALAWRTSNVLVFNTASSGGQPGTDYLFAWTPSTNTWYHVAVSRSGTSLRAFINGTQIGSTQTDSTNLTDSDGIGLKIGTASDDAGDMNGWLDEIRIKKGTAVYTANFTAPTAAFSPTAVDLTLISNTQAALDTPTDIFAVLWQEDVDSITLNTDLKAYASRNGGTTYTQITLAEVANLTTGRILTGTVDISGQSSATAMKYKIETLNTKDQKIHAVALQWS